MSFAGKKKSASEKGKRAQTFPVSSSEPALAPRLMGSAIRARQGFELDVGVGGSIRDVENRDYPMTGGDFSGAGDDDDGGSTEHLDDSEIAERSSRRPVPVVERLTPFRYHRDGMIEELPDLSPGLDRSHGADEQDWSDVGPTLSDYESLSSLMEKSQAFGVTFVIPRSDQRPWTPPVGYCCVYESFFGDDSKLWFPIPRLITSYCFRRGIALSQLMNGAVRIAVALMVMAAEIDVSMSVRAFEELTQTQPKPNGVYSVQMRSGLHILTSPHIKTKTWKRSYFYVKADEAGFEDPPSADCRVLWSRSIGRTSMLISSILSLVLTLSLNSAVGHPNTFEPWDALRRDLPKIVVLRLQEWRSFDRYR
ncbi:hypothetical protein Bca101_020005 [Brassica carinata]